MTETEIRELATELILDHARDIEWLTIGEMLPEGLTHAEHDEAKRKIDDLIRRATITVELPGTGA